MALLEKDADLIPMIINLECENLIKCYNLSIKKEQLVNAYKIIRNYLTTNHINYKSQYFNYDQFLTSLLQVNKDFYTAVMLAILAGNFCPSKLQNLRTHCESNTHQIGYYCEDIKEITLVYCGLLSHSEFDCNNLLLPEIAKKRIQTYCDNKYHSDLAKINVESSQNSIWKPTYPSNNRNN